MKILAAGAGLYHIYMDSGSICRGPELPDNWPEITTDVEEPLIENGYILSSEQ